MDRKDRLTHERVNGIKSGYWSPENKEVLVQRLAEYENTGLSPREINRLWNKVFADWMLAWTADNQLDIGEKVMVCRPGPDGPIVEQGTWLGEGWWRVYGTRTKAVTHWMPLPDPPKEGER